MGSLSNLYISQSYQSLIHLATNNTASATLIGLQDGLGNSIGVSVNTGGNLYLSGSLSASLQQGYAWVGDSNNRNTLVPTSSFGGATPAGTISSSAQITGLGFVSSSVTASSLITASFSGNTLTFTKGNGTTFGVVIPDVSGSTGNFATTGSNTFVGNQTITGSLFISGNINMVNGADIVTHHVRAQGSNGLELQTSAGTIIVAMGQGGGTQAAFVGAVTANSISASTINGIGNVTNYSTSVDSRLDNLEAATSSYVTSAITASSLITASVNLNTITFTKGDASTFNITVDTGSGGGGGNVSVQDEGTILGNATSFNFTGAGVTATLSAGTASVTIPGGGGSIDTGSFATTGSNRFTGNQTIEGAIVSNPTTSLIKLYSSAFVSGAVQYNITASAAISQSNLIFGGTALTATQTGSIIISGSNNILLSPARNVTATTFGYIGGNNNIIASTIPTLSTSSLVSPTVSNNNINAALTLTFTTSSLAVPSISNNIILANATINHPSGSINYSNNINGGTISSQATTTNLPFLTTIQNNSFLGNTTTLNHISSSITCTNNIGGGLTVNNTVSSSVSATNNGLTLSNNLFAGSGNIIFTSGSSVTTRRNIITNLFGGNNNVISASALNSENQNLVGTAIWGTGLNVSATSNGTGATVGGSAFFGRFNNINNLANESGKIIFAVGTGTSTSARKTGFLIDSGSNTFIEGTLNVSGSSTFTGSVIVTGSLFVNGISAVIPVGTVSSSTQIVAYGIFATTGSNTFNGNQRITGSLTISGSIITVDRSGNDGNTYMGQNALGMGTAGAQPLAVGNSISVAIGQGAMRFASGSNQNVAIGNNALLNTSGSKNFAMGSEALSGNTTGASNIAIGTSALQNNTTGGSSTAIGDSAAQFASGSQNTFIGHSSGYNVTGSNNVIIGSYRGVAGEKIDNNIILSDGQQNIKAQYSGSAWSLQDGIKLNKGSNKTTDIVSVNSTLTVSNSLVTATSIILVTTQNSTTGPVYPAVITSKGAGTFDIAHNFGGSLDVAYFIINPT